MWSMFKIIQKLAPAPPTGLYSPDIYQETTAVSFIAKALEERIHLKDVPVMN